MNKRASGSTRRSIAGATRDGEGSTRRRDTLSAEAATLLKADHGPVSAVKHGATQGIIGSVAAAAAHNTGDKQALYNQSVATLRRSIFEHSKEANTLESARKGFLDGFANGASSTKMRGPAAKAPAVTSGAPSPAAEPKESSRQKAQRDLSRRMEASGMNDSEAGVDRERE